MTKWSALLALFLLLLAFTSTFYDTTLYEKHLTQVHENPQPAIEFSHSLIDYFLSTNTGFTYPNLTPEEASHLKDVKRLMCLAELLIITLIALLRNHLTNNKKKAATLKTATYYLLTLPLLALLPFKTLFTMFHQLLFPQGNWMFPTSSLLITSYPISFFILMAQTTLTRLAILAFIVYCVAKSME